MRAPTPEWLSEINLDPTAPAATMGTRSLGSRPWLVVDDAHAEELALKEQLCAERHSDVFAAGPECEAAAETVGALIEQSGVALRPLDQLHPLDRAGRSVQEDLCLLNRRPEGWHLTAASLCFPSRWSLGDKIDKHITAVHGPVRNYRDALSTRVDRLFDRLTSSPVWRRNWFVHPDPSLFQPTRPAAEELVPSDSALESLYLRSERQTLRAIDPQGWLLFTIKTQQVPLSVVAADPELRSALANYLKSAAPKDLAGRGMATAQVDQILAALDNV